MQNHTTAIEAAGQIWAHVLPAIDQVPEGYEDFSILYFTRHEDHFIIAVNTHDEAILKRKAISMQRATAFTWDKKIIRGWEHNFEIECNQMADAKEDQEGIDGLDYGFCKPA